MFSIRIACLASPLVHPLVYPLVHSLTPAPKLFGG
jgi:hypothetical protein